MVAYSEFAAQILILGRKSHPVDVIADAGTEDVTEHAIETEVQIPHVTIVPIEIEREKVYVGTQPPLATKGDRAEQAYRGQRCGYFQALEFVYDLGFGIWDFRLPLSGSRFSNIRPHHKNSSTRR